MTKAYISDITAEITKHGTTTANVKQSTIGSVHLVSLATLSGLMYYIMLFRSEIVLTTTANKLQIG